MKMLTPRNVLDRGSLTYTAVNSSGGLWQFDLNQYAVAGNTYGGAVSPAIADTGSSLLMLDPTIVDNYYEQVPTSSDDQQGKIFPCDTALPDFSFGIENSMATIPGSLLNYTSIPGTPGKPFLSISMINVRLS